MTASLSALLEHAADTRDRNRAAVLRALGRHGQTTPARLADALPMHRTTILFHLRALAASGDATCTGRGPATRWARSTP